MDSAAISALAAPPVGRYRFLQLGGRWRVLLPPRPFRLLVVLAGIYCLGFAVPTFGFRWILSRSVDWVARLSLASAVLCVSSMACLVTSAVVEPGILPRSSRPPEDALRFYREHSRYPRSKPSHSAGNNYEHIWFCGTCLHWIPFRAFHCHRCDVCVSVFDHHCEMTGGCVGERNYAFFFASVVLLVLGACAAFINVPLFLYVRSAELGGGGGNGGACATLSCVFARVWAARLGTGGVRFALLVIDWWASIICMSSYGTLLVQLCRGMQKNLTTFEQLRRTAQLRGELTTEPEAIARRGNLLRERFLARKPRSLVWPTKAPLDPTSSVHRELLQLADHTEP